MNGTSEYIDVDPAATLLFCLISLTMKVYFVVNSETFYPRVHCRHPRISSLLKCLKPIFASPSEGVCSGRLKTLSNRIGDSRRFQAIPDDSQGPAERAWNPPGNASNLFRGCQWGREGGEPVQDLSALEDLGRSPWGST